MKWVHSHVDEVGRRDTSKAKYPCACGAKDECNPEHWAHQGNEQADEQAKQGAYMPMLPIEEAMSGDNCYVLAKIDNSAIAQGIPRKWIQKADLEATVTSEGCTSVNKMKRAKENSHQGLFESITKTLDKPGLPTWRFWARGILGCLPTHARMAKFANASEDNAYSQVYAGDIGEEGCCPRCGEGKETQRHALWECKESEVRWQRIDHMIEKKWDENNMNWKAVGWIWNTEDRYPEWTVENMMMGLTPSNIDTLINLEIPSHFAVVKETAMMILKASSDIWESRNEALKEWMEQHDELKKRKETANRKGWTKQGDGAPADRSPRNKAARTRLGMAIDKRRDTIKEATKQAEKNAEELAQEHLDQCEQNGTLPPHPMAMQRAKRAVVTRELRGTKRKANAVVKRARMAEGTRSITQQEMDQGQIKNTQPASMSKKITHFWVPRVQTLVKVFKPDVDGDSLCENLRGEWVSGKVTKLEWPEEKGIPGVWIKHQDGNKECMVQDQ